MCPRTVVMYSSVVPETTKGVRRGEATEFMGATGADESGTSLPKIQPPLTRVHHGATR